MTNTGSKTAAALGDVVEAGKSDMSDALAGLQRNLDEVRSTLSSLVAQVGDNTAAAGDRGIRRVREMAGSLADDFADRAGEGVASLRGKVEEQPMPSLALAFGGGVVVGAAVAALLTSGNGDRPPRRR